VRGGYRRLYRSWRRGWRVAWLGWEMRRTRRHLRSQPAKRKLPRLSFKPHGAIESTTSLRTPHTRPQIRSTCRERVSPRSLAHGSMFRRVAQIPQRPKQTPRRARCGRFRRSRTIVFGPPSGVTTAGTPLARASRTTLPKVSVCDGRRRDHVRISLRQRFPAQNAGESARRNRSRSHASSPRDRR